MRRLTIKGLKTVSLLMRISSANITSLLQDTLPALQEGAERVGFKAEDFLSIELQNKDYNDAISISGISSLCKITYIYDAPDGFQYRIRVGWEKESGNVVSKVKYIQKIKKEGEYDLVYTLTPTNDPELDKEKRWSWVFEEKRKNRSVNNIPAGWNDVTEVLPEQGKINSNTKDYQKYMCLVKVNEKGSADARPLAFTDKKRWVNGNVDMTDYVLAWQGLPAFNSNREDFLNDGRLITSSVGDFLNSG